MKTTEEKEPIPPIKPHRWNNYRPEDIKRWGVERFLNEVCPQQPIPVPNFEFTEEENRRMDELLGEEREQIDRDNFARHNLHQQNEENF